MRGMFFEATNFNKSIINWDVSEVNNMESMFASASNFNQNISNWCVTKILSEPVDFSTDSILEDVYKPNWGSCPSNEIVASGILTPYSQTVESKWILVGIDFFPGTKVRVFDKNGYLVYESENYNNEWGGLNKKGEMLPAGSYYYLIIKPNQTTMDGWLFLTY
jgi:gliding motility-associated-like protein